MEYLIISLVSLVVAALTFFSGFGLGTLLMPAFALFFPIEVAIAATAVVHLVNNIFKVYLLFSEKGKAVINYYSLQPAAEGFCFGELVYSFKSFYKRFLQNVFCIHLIIKESYCYIIHCF